MAGEQKKKRVTAAVLIVGNEILSGRTHDINLKYLGIELNLLGIQVREARVVPDIDSEIVDAVNTLRKKYDYLFTTGGIGPTHDDITSGCIAQAFGQKLIRHPVAEKLLRERMAQMGTEATPARLRMCETPEHAEVLPNKVGGAPGYRIENVFVMAGIPRIMHAMFEAAVPHLEGGVTLQATTVGSMVPEGAIATGLGELQDAYPELDVGSYPFTIAGKPGSNLVIRGADEAQIAEAAENLRALIVELGGEPIDGGIEHDAKG
jgi:molybdenum cofactor synthesis domain-containing protein